MNEADPLLRPAAAPLSAESSVKSTWDAIVLAVFVASIYTSSSVGSLLVVLTDYKIEEDPTGFSKETVNKCQMLYFLGCAISCLVVMPFSDKLGRKIPIYGLVALVLVAAVAGSVATTVWLYALSIFVLGFSLMPAAILSYVLVRESLRQELGGTIAVTLNFVFSLHFIFMVLSCKYLTKQMNWRVERLLWYSPYAIVLAGGPFLAQESPHFMKRGAPGAPHEEVAGKDPGSLWHTLRRLGQPDLFGVLGATSVCWVAVSVSFYGLSYSAGELSSDVFANSLLLALVDMVGYVLPALPISRLGASLTQMLSFGLLALFLFICSWTPEGHWLTVTLAMIGRLCADFAFTTVFILIVDCFPPECRSTAGGVANFFGRASTFLSPLAALVPHRTTCFVLAGLSALGAACSHVIMSATSSKRAGKLVDDPGL